MKISILGCGNWGSVFAIIQHRNKHEVRIWEYDRERCKKIQNTRDNSPFLTGHLLPDDIMIHWDIAQVVHDTELVVFAVPTQTLTSVAKAAAQVKSNDGYYLNLTKGIDMASLKRPSEIITDHLGTDSAVFTLSGPCIANEIIRGFPAAAVVVGTPEQKLSTLQHELATNTFRVYQGSDIIGVELAGAIKNVIAIACGISDGLGFGANTKGALITRGIVEIQRLGVQQGAKINTFWGLSGLGDLVTTSFSDQSRNHRFGVCIGQGMAPDQIQKEMVMVAEGVPTAQAIQTMKSRYSIDMPICDSVYNIIYKNESPKQAIQELMSRPLTHE